MPDRTADDRGRRRRLADRLARVFPDRPDRTRIVHSLADMFRARMFAICCGYRRRRDPSSYVPEHAPAPVKKSVFLPYIFSSDEVRRILAAAISRDNRFVGASMLHTLILVLYCTGLTAQS